MFEYEFTLTSSIPGYKDKATVSDRLEVVSDYCSERGRRGHRLHTVKFNGENSAQILVFEIPVKDEPGQVW